MTLYCKCSFGNEEIKKLFILFCLCLCHYYSCPSNILPVSWVISVYVNMQDLHRLTQMRNKACEKVVDAAVKVRLYSSQSWSKWSSEQSVTDVPLRRISFLSDRISTAYIMILVYPNSGICPLELHHSLNASGDMSETWVRWERRALQRWSVLQNKWSSSLTITHSPCIYSLNRHINI